MYRPPAIIRYEQLYFASFALGLIATAVTWQARAASIARHPMLADAPWIGPAVLVFSITISLTLWYFTARAPSVVAKWVVVAFAAVSAGGMAFTAMSLIAGRVPAAQALLSIAVSALYVAAATLLFRAEARLWFGESSDAEDEDA